MLKTVSLSKLAKVKYTDEIRLSVIELGLTDTSWNKPKFKATSKTHVLVNAKAHIVVQQNSSKYSSCANYHLSSNRTQCWCSEADL